MKSMFKMLSVIAITSISTITYAQTAEDAKVVWGGGDPKVSEYSSVYVPQIINVLNQNRLSGYVWSGPSAGTIQNAKEVTDHPTNLALGQLDILQTLQGKPIPEEAGKTYDFTILKKNIGPECLYMITKQEGYNTWGDVLGNAWDMTIVTGSKGSGSYGTLDNLINIYPDLKSANIVNVDATSDIINRVKNDPSVTHGFFVMRPDPNSDIFKAINDAGLHIIPIVDFDLDGKYEFENLKVAYGGIFGQDKYVTTACTSVALITGTTKNVDSNDTRTIKRVEETIARISKVNDDDLKPNISTWQDMWGSIKQISADQTKSLMEQSKQAFDKLSKEMNKNN